MITTAKKPNNYFDGLPVSKKHIFLFLLIVLAYFFEQLDNNNFAFIAPAMIKSGFMTKEKIAIIVSTYFLGMTAGGFLGGIISDIIGRRKTFLIAMLIFSSMSVLNGFAINFTVFLIARVATGFGILMMMVTSMAYIAEVTPGESRGKWQSLINTGGFCAMPVIGLISKAIIPIAPDAWRWIFYMGALGFITFILGIKYLDESPRWLVAKGRVEEAEQMIKKYSGIDVDLSEAAQNVPPKINAAEQFIGMFSGKYLKRTLILLLFGIPATACAFACAVWIPTLATMKGFTLDQSLSIGTAYMFGAPIGLFVVSFFADKGGRKVPLSIMLFVMALIIFVYGHMNTYVGALIFACLINAALMGMSSMQTAYNPEHYPTKMRNTAVGTINALQRLGVSGSQLIIPIIVAGYGVGGLFVGISILLVFAAVVVITLGERTGGVPLEQIE
jgi:Sugar phosphate permease